jgi:predicted NAD/FAD-dependent oxidoreductase
MATRRIDSDRFDHGAQFFTVRTPEFQKLVDEWLAIGIAKEWSRGFPSSPDGHATDGHPRYCGCNGMKSIVKYLSQGLMIHDRTKISSITYGDSGWDVVAEDGRTWQADILLMTPPVPQALELLGSVVEALDSSVAKKLRSVAYDKCLALMVRFARSVPLGQTGALQVNDEPIAWIADNGVKKISPEAGTLTIHAGPQFSNEHWDTPESDVTKRLLRALPIAVSLEPSMTKLHRWRYAQPAIGLSEPALFTSIPGPIAFAGDAFGGAKVEGAALSGEAAALAILAHF